MLEVMEFFSGPPVSWFYSKGKALKLTQIYLHSENNEFYIEGQNLLE